FIVALVVAQGSVGDDDDVLPLGGDELAVGIHPRLQADIRVYHLHLDGNRGHVLFHGRLRIDPLDLALEQLVGIGIHLDVDRLADLDGADVGFIDLAGNEHPTDVAELDDVGALDDGGAAGGD